MDGLEVLRALRADASLRTLPVIALTAHAMLGDRERFLRSGFDAYAPKPLDFKKLDELIRKQAQKAVEQLTPAGPIPTAF